MKDYDQCVLSPVLAHLEGGKIRVFVLIDASYRLQSETASLEIPEIELELHTGTLGGKFTTIEGLLQSVRDQLKQLHPFSMGDSSDVSNMSAFLGQLDEACVCVWGGGESGTMNHFEHDV